MNLIVAATESNGIGLNGKLPWRLRNDMKYFADLTTNLGRSGLENACLMGRKTWDSIPPKFRPLAGRLNIVLTRTPGEDQEFVKYCTSIQQALEIAKDRNLWVIGGAEIYKLTAPQCKLLFITKVSSTNPVECDTFLDLNFDEFERLDDQEFKNIVSGHPIGVQKEGDFEYEFQIWRKKQ